MEDYGTPPVVGRYLSDELDSPAYHTRGTMRAWPPNDSRGLKNSPFFPAATGQTSAADVDNVLRLLEENWYWKAEPRAEDWASLKTLEHQRSQKYSALRSSLAQGSNAQASQRLANGMRDYKDHDGITREAAIKSGQSSLQHEQTGLEVRTSAGVESDTAESDWSEPPSRNGDAITPNERNPEDVDSLGTWAQRVLLFPTKQENKDEQPDTSAQAQLSKRQQSLRRQESKEEEEAAHAAWRWRFNRRWRQEQQKQLDPDFGMDGADEDGWEDALGYLDACGPGVHLQIGRMSSDKPSGSLVSSSSGGWGLLTNESMKEKTLGHDEENATNNIASKAKKVQELYATQKKIEKDVKARWGNTKVSMNWAGCHVNCVAIDMYGQFPFILAKISDNTKTHRLVVRGRRALTHKELLKALNTEVEGACSRHRLPMVKVSLLGTGVMEWSREKADRINVCQGQITHGSDVCQSKDDVVRVAGALTRSSLSAPAMVTINGEKLS